MGELETGPAAVLLGQRLMAQGGLKWVPGPWPGWEETKGDWTGTVRAGGACRILTLITFTCILSGHMDPIETRAKKSLSMPSISMSFVTVFPTLLSSRLRFFLTFFFIDSVLRETLGFDLCIPD